MTKKTWTWTPTSSFERSDVAICHAIESAEGHWSDGEQMNCSRSQIQRLIDEGHVLSNGLKIKARTKLIPGDKIQVFFPPPRPLDVLPESLPLNILFQDQHLIVINKPQGMTVHPSSTQMEGTLVNALLHHVKDLSGIGGKLRPGIVHRIDKDTSGVLVVTKTDLAHRKLVEVFSKHEIDRVYWALVYGAPASSEKIRIESKLARNPKDRKKITAVSDNQPGRIAVTYAKKIEEYGTPKAKPFASWLELTLETGRTHQIRVHLTSVHHSILGDPVYGVPTEQQAKWKALPKQIQIQVNSLKGQALHAQTLGFTHPITGEKLKFEAEPPAAFCDLMRSLKQFSSSQSSHTV